MSKNKSKKSSRPVPVKIERFSPHGWLILLLALVCDFNSWGHQFVMDDWNRIVGAPLIQSLYNISKLFISPFHLLDLMRSTINRPFTSFTFAINWWISGPQPDGFHWFNRLIHILICLGIFRVFQLLFPQRKFLALITSLFFAVHPIQTEAITYITGRADALALLLFIYSWLLFIRVRLSPSLLRWAYIGSLFLYFFALLSKESAISWLGIALLTEFSCFGHGDIRTTWRALRQNWIRIYGGYVLVTCAYLALRFPIVREIIRVDVTPLDNPSAHVSTAARIMTALKILFLSIGQILWPFHLSADYSYNEIQLITQWKSLGGITVLFLTLILLVLLAWSFRHAPHFFFGLAYFLITYSVVSNILIPIGTIRADRLLYMPALGFCFLIATVLEPLESRFKTKSGQRLFYGGIAILLALLAMRTIERNRVWQDESTLYAQTVLDSPQSAKAHNNLGVQLFSRGDLEGAMAQYQLAEAIKPDYPDLLSNTGTLLSREGRYSEAASYLRRAVAISPMNLKIRNNLGLVLRAGGQLQDAITEYDWIISHDPRNAAAHFNRGNALYAQGKTKEAIEEYSRTLQIDPNFELARSNLNAIIQNSPSDARVPPISLPH
jgi:tetratricopeptide (TPR) repeat protein